MWPAIPTRCTLAEHKNLQTPLVEDDTIVRVQAGGRKPPTCQRSILCQGPSAGLRQALTKPEKSSRWAPEWQICKRATGLGEKCLLGIQDAASMPLVYSLAGLGPGPHLSGQRRYPLRDEWKGPHVIVSALAGVPDRRFGFGSVDLRGLFQHKPEEMRDVFGQVVRRLWRHVVVSIKPVSVCFTDFSYFLGCTQVPGR